MSYRAEPKGSMKAYLQQRSMEERIAEAATITAQHTKAVEFMRDYRARGRKTAFNWSPSITVTKTEETTSEEAEIHHTEEATNGPQAAEVGIAEGVGDAPEECGSPEVAVGPDGAGDVRGQCEHEQAAGSRFAIAGHTDFGDGDTPF